MTLRPLTLSSNKWQRKDDNFVVTIWNKKGLMRALEPGELSWYSDRLEVGVRFPAGAREFSLFHNIQTDSGPHPAYPVLPYFLLHCVLST
jgi:hypothetical protein